MAFRFTCATAGLADLDGPAAAKEMIGDRRRLVQSPTS
jgi:hypothetical protein